MSEAVRQPDTASRACPGLLASLDALLRGWLPRQRWFAGKGRPVTGFTLVSSTELLPVARAAGRTPTPACPPGLIHLLVRAEQDTPGAHGIAHGPAGDCYQLLLGVRDALPSPLAHALIGQVTEGPLAGGTVYEALYDPLLAEVLLEALRRRARIGSLRFERDPGTEIGHGLPPRMLGAEQSNSSLVYGDAFILKLFRRIVPGINPDLELPHALARTRCPRVPPPAAWFVAGAAGLGRLGFSGAPVSGTGVGGAVQAGSGALAPARSSALPSAGSAVAVSAGPGGRTTAGFGERFSSGFADGCAPGLGERCSSGPAPAPSSGPTGYGVAAPSGAGTTVSTAGCLSPSRPAPPGTALTAPSALSAPYASRHAGRRAAAALPPDTLVLGVLQPYLRGATDGWQLALSELAKGADFRAEARALGRATAEVHTALADALPTVTLGRAQMERLATGMAERLNAAVQAVPALRRYASGLRSAYDALASLGTRDRSWLAQRVHGDLHLGQCLRAPSGEWSLIDFEGEPARPLAERCMPQPPVRDIAGILRSFDYAARSHQPWAPAWAHGCRGAYCAGYAEVTGRDPRAEPVLLRAYETDKAIYEVMYEARHRPDWLPVPLAAIHRLARADAPPPPP